MSRPSTVDRSKQPAVHRRWRELSAWLVIMGLTLLAVYQNARSDRIKAGQTFLSDMAIKLRTEQAIEFKLLQMRMDPRRSSTLSISIDRLIEQMTRDARTPEDR